MEINTHQIGGILAYKSNGHNKQCGQIIGANGAGEFYKVFIGHPNEAEKAALEYIQNLKIQGYRDVSHMFIKNEEFFTGEQISFHFCKKESEND